MYKITVTDENGDIVGVIENVTPDEDEANEKEGYWIRSQGGRTALSDTIGKVILNYEKQGRDAGSGVFYRNDLPFYG